MPDAATTVCRRFRVTGRVQGVFFRASTRDVALGLNLKGHAVNLPDGSVEVLACGDDVAVQKLADWLASGPPMASVNAIESSPAECAVPHSFSTG